MAASCLASKNPFCQNVLYKSAARKFAMQRPDLAPFGLFVPTSRAHTMRTVSHAVLGITIRMIGPLQHRPQPSCPSTASRGLLHCPRPPLPWYAQAIRHAMR